MIQRHEAEIKWIFFLKSPFLLYHEGIISKKPNFFMFFLLKFKKHKISSHGQR